MDQTTSTTQSTLPASRLTPIQTRSTIEQRIERHRRRIGDQMTWFAARITGAILIVSFVVALILPDQYATPASAIVLILASMLYLQVAIPLIKALIYYFK